MICNKRKSKAYLQALSQSECKYCGQQIISPHIPCYCVCEVCSEKYSVCEQCGEEIDK